MAGASTQRWRETIEDLSFHRWWVAEHDCAVIGFVGIGPSRDPADPEIGEIDTIAVAPSHWHQGVGKSLMAHALEGLLVDGYKHAILWTLNDYPLGEKFYVSTGWVKSDATRNDGDQVQFECEITSC